MICPKCNIEMIIGKAILNERDISGDCRCWHYDPTIKAEDVKLSDCWKCPKCGLSETIDNV